ncbi:winged helix DNA-binding domain-containing protein [Nocardia cyriacigeorgica]|uniref:Winged helix DNA-binding domain-containing protein n=1 Tax=Nocardia cyriacigeorgica TaxID=135487 RepID=A0A5R8P8Q1_9NOCA|nr:crosslink repair DNA glycosylase YcaQ family protein [Nocardia cyriacigeorgica]TLG01903.1 winged helix DNA-binding domain-containing protein [Nocardia cyriacigeorgica]
MAGALVVDRKRWLGHRWDRHGFGASGTDLDDLLLLGVQDGRPDGALRSLRARSMPARIGPDGPLVAMWSVRGAPHVHRLDRLDFVTAAHTPIPSDSGGADRVWAVEVVAEALRAVVTGPISKSDASTAVTRRVPEELVSWCARCRAHHVPDALFRTAGCRAQILVGADERRATLLYPAPDHPREHPRRPRAALLDTFFHVNGPITRALFADWLGVEPADIAQVWQGADLVPVRIDDRRYSLPAAVIDHMLAAPDPSGTVLVPPHDPYLRQTDRALLVPDAARRKLIWRPVSAPGAVLDAGEVMGIWRYRGSGNVVTVTGFDTPTPGLRKRVRQAAAAVLAVSGARDLEVEWE